MFYSLRGELIHTDKDFVVIECAGVGYKCFTTLNTQKAIPKQGGEVKLFTYLSVREDAMDIFGFFSEQELNCFKQLISVSGVGAKVGLGILSVLSSEQVAMAIASGDSKLLTMAPGVGNKLALRINLELKDKINKKVMGNGAIQSMGLISAASNASQAVSALTVLGYSQAEITPIIAKFDSSISVEELIRLSLKELAGGV